jgi:5-hydroxyisourate hydrolase
MSTHVLDAVRGAPAAGLQVQLYRLEATGWELLSDHETDADGRVVTLAFEVEPGHHRLVFATAAYFAQSQSPSFYPEVVVSFTVADERHYHVPLLLSPYAYSTYRGS